MVFYLSKGETKILLGHHFVAGTKCHDIRKDYGSRLNGGLQEIATCEYKLSLKKNRSIYFNFVLKGLEMILDYLRGSLNPMIIFLRQRPRYRREGHMKREADSGVIRPQGMKANQKLEEVRKILPWGIRGRVALPTL